MLEPMRRAWVDCLRKEGLTGTLDRAFHLQNGDAVSAYISKHGRDETDRAAATDARPAWGIAEEMTLARTKRGKGQGSRSPWQILRDAASGDEAAARLWQEYALVMHGRRQQVWSDGLKEAVGLVEVEDEEAAEGEEYTADEDEKLEVWTRAQWRSVRHLRAALLAAAETGGAAAVRRLLDARPALVEDDAALIEPVDITPQMRRRASLAAMDQALDQIEADAGQAWFISPPVVRRLTIAQGAALDQLMADIEDDEGRNAWGFGVSPPGPDRGSCKLARR